MNNAIKPNIIKTTLLFLFLQYSIFLLSLFLIHFFQSSIPFWITVWFFISATLYHVLIGYGLLKLSDEFVVESTGEYLKTINLANMLTIFRLSSLPTIFFLLLLAKQYPVQIILVIQTTATFLSDLFDGAVSRLTKKITKIGRKLDSTSDYMILFIISIAFMIYSVLPVWFFWLIIIRGVMMVFIVSTLSYLKGAIFVATSVMGKVSIFAIMALYAFEIFKIIGLPYLGNQLIVQYLEYVTAAVIVVSIIDKLYFFQKQLKILDKPEDAQD